MNFFNFFKENNKQIEIKVPELNKNIGITSAICPYCGSLLKKFPIKKTKCKNCGEYMYVRTRPSDYKKIVIKEEDINLLEDEWEKKRYINVINKENKAILQNNDVKSITIDTSEDMDIIIKNLIKDYKQFCNYPEILNIKKEDRLPILKYIWSKWAIRPEGIYKDLMYSLPQYNKEDIELITRKEHSRLNIYYHCENYKKLHVKGLIQYYNLIGSTKYIKETNEYYKPILKFCLKEDMPLVYNAWRQEDGKINRTMFILSGSSAKNVEELYLFYKGKENLITIDELKNFCEKNNLEFPLKDV